MSSVSQSVQCCIAGGGPAGMMLGVLLARAGVSVVVLEKHGDFLRDFRGDTLHPSTLDVIDELGLLDPLLQLPHQKCRGLLNEALIAGYVSKGRRKVEKGHTKRVCPRGCHVNKISVIEASDGGAMQDLPFFLHGNACSA